MAYQQKKSTTEERRAPKSVTVATFDEMKQRRGEKAARPVKARFSTELSRAVAGKPTDARKARNKRKAAKRAGAK